MNKRATPARPGTGQRGMALISALLLLLVISLLAVGVSMDTSMDVRTAGYQRFRALAFSSSESGAVAAADILVENKHAGGWVNPNPGNPFDFPNPVESQYVGDILILSDGDFFMNPNTTAQPIIQLTGEIEAVVATQNLRAVKSEGAAIQVAAGYAGFGKGSGAGGVQRIYDIQVTGYDAGGAGEEHAHSDLGLNYRVLTGK